MKGENEIEERRYKAIREMILERERERAKEREREREGRKDDRN